MTVALPRGRPHSDPRCTHLTYARRHVTQVLLTDTAPICRDCRRREVQRRRRERMASDAALIARIRAEVAATDPAEIVRWVVERAKRADTRRHSAGGGDTRC